MKKPQANKPLARSFSAELFEERLPVSDKYNSGNTDKEANTTPGVERIVVVAIIVVFFMMKPATVLLVHLAFMALCSIITILSFNI